MSTKTEEVRTQPKDLGANDIRWDLSDLFAGLDDPRIETILAEGKVAAEAFMLSNKGNLAGLDAASLAAAFGEVETIYAPYYKVSQYSHLVLATNVSDEQAKALVSRVDDVGSEISNFLVFFDLELGSLSEAQFQALVSSPDLAPYTYQLEHTYKSARHHLTEKEEQVINLKDLTGSDGFQKLYNEYTSSFQFEFEVDGEKKKMNGSELRALRYHPDAKVRREAMCLFFDRYEKDQLLFSHVFNNIIKDHFVEKDLRGFTTSINVRNTQNDLSEKAVSVLHDVTTRSNHLVNRYYKIKSKLLGLTDMTLADIYAPLPQSVKEYSWEEAKTIVCDGFKAFDDELFSFVKTMYDENRIDAPVQPSKRGGAFCSGYTPDIKPYVLLNFLGRQRDISTIAHELGHAIHDILCSKQSLLNFHPILPLAETASVFSEMIITDMLLKTETDKSSRQALLTDKLEDVFATSHRQNMFSRFEKASHAAIGKKLMSSTELCDLYQSELELMFGDAIKYTPEYRWEWASIPHIFEAPFYVHAYNFGNLLVMSLYQQYLEEGKAFVPKFKDFLSRGCSASPADITKLVGADIESPEFWEKSLRYIESLIDELEAVVD
ncbi:MAG: oligoendopeptidase F [Candidatus Marinamargulisbacteria bacterium]|jgi:oligoendopeptidase F